MKRRLSTLAASAVLVFSANANALLSSPVDDYPTPPSQTEFQTSTATDMFSSTVWFAAKQRPPNTTWHAIHVQLSEKEMSGTSPKAGLLSVNGLSGTAYRVYKQATSQENQAPYGVYSNVFGLEADRVASPALQSKITVPEPITMFLFGAGLSGLAALGRRRMNRISGFKEERKTTTNRLRFTLTPDSLEQLPKKGASLSQIVTSY